MKRLLVLLLAVFMIAGLTACGGEGEEDLNFDDMSFMSVYNAETNDIITLGVSQGKIEEIIGTPSKENDGLFLYGDEDDCMAVRYQDYIAHTIVIVGDTPWRVKYGFGPSDDINDVFRYYGGKEIEEHVGLDDELIATTVPYYFNDSEKIVGPEDEYSFSIYFDLTNGTETVRGAALFLK